MINDIQAIKDILPRGVHHSVSGEIVDLVQSMGADTGIFQEYMEDSFKTHIPALKDVSCSLKDYVSAIKYCNLQVSLNSNSKAWVQTFPEKYDELKRKGKESDLSVHVAIYNKRKIVVRLQADMMTAFYIQYAGARHEAIMKNIQLMRGQAAPTKMPRKKKVDGKIVIQKNSKGDVIMDEVYMTVSPQVQHLAASKVLDMTIPPEDKTLNVKIGLSDEVVKQGREISDKLEEIAILQRNTVLKGGDITDVQVIGNVLTGDEDDTV